MSLYNCVFPEVIFEPEVDQATCRDGARECHSNAVCEDFDTGFCCRCTPPTYGNGRFCIDPSKFNIVV